MPIPNSEKLPAKTALDRLIDDYLASCRARGLSSKTVKFVYAYTLRSVFTPFCQREGITEPSQVTRRVMDRFTTELLDGTGRARPLARTTVHSYGRGVNSFLRWAASEGEIKPDVKAQLQRAGGGECACQSPNATSQESAALRGDGGHRRGAPRVGESCSDGSEGRDRCP